MSNAFSPLTPAVPADPAAWMDLIKPRRQGGLPGGAVRLPGMWAEAVKPGLRSVPAGGVGPSAAGTSAEQAARDFESVLLLRLMEEMRRTVPDSGLLSTGAGRQIEDIFWYYLAQDVAEGGGLGLWQQLLRQGIAGAGAGGAAPAAEASP